MKVVALVSGGKDSCFNMMLCQRYGHEVVALANLLPTQAEVDELDSYMYQTVGHQIVAAYASCMGLPLYRRKILGSSKEQRLVYEDTTGDEVEDLAALISYIKTEIPDIGAISSGAIASDYQRTRVERVCSRLGLVSLAFLWHQPQDPLLQRMIDAGIKAILVKVAAAGLNPRAHLGASLAQVQPHLRRLRQTYGCNICGEGGEYETMTLDCPIFTQGRIILDAWDTIHVSEDSMAPVALLHPTQFHVEAKTLEEASFSHDTPGGAPSSSNEALVIEVPDDYIAVSAIETDSLNAGYVQKPTTSDTSNNNIKLYQSVNGTSACQSITAQIVGPPCSTVPITTTLQNAFQAISDALSADNLTWHDALFIHLYVPDMSQFGSVNAVYSTFLPAINPPARACVQLAAGDVTKNAITSRDGEIPSLVVEVLLRNKNTNTILSSNGGSWMPEDKKVLHVQSISEWAPSCIGPYSQAVALNGLVYFAGQIPLDPPTMEVATEDSAAATERSLLSCQAVAIAMKTDLRQGSLWWTVYTSSKTGSIGREAVEGRLDAFLAGEEFTTGNDGKAEDEEKDKDDQNEDTEQESDDDEVFVDDYLLAPSMPHRHWTPLVTFIEMPELPRGVVVEVQPVAWSSYGNPIENSSSDSSDNDDIHSNDKVNRKKTFFNGPRWASQLESKRKKVNAPAGHVELHILKSIGNLAKGSAFIMDVAAGKSVEEASGQAAAELVKEMLGEASGLGVEDIVTAKIYLPVNHEASTHCGAVDAIRNAVNAELISGSRSNGSPPAATDAGVAVVVPVLRVGSSAESNAKLCIELLAQK